MSSKQQPETPFVEAIPAVILAAGKGTRMKGKEPKAAVRVGGRPMAARVADAMRGAGLSRIVAVVGHRADDVRAAIGDGVEYVIQDKQSGTGHAARCAEPALRGYRGPIVIAYADIRILRGPEGRVTGIVEAKDATPEQLTITETNVGVYCFHAPVIFEILAHLKNENAQRQYYLTDAVGILVSRRQPVRAVALRAAHNGMGVDTQEDLHRAQRISATGEAV
jgi:bifunctional UDP-N-acetylglucosamine pyrophosphorylase/glucosamine-1-phosphate N-acetyltransferase